MSSNLVTNLQSTPYPLHSVTVQGAYEPFDLQVARNQIMGHQVTNVFGYATAIPNTGFIAVWENNSAYVFPSVASTMLVTSSSASDTAVTILISGLNASYVQITESVTLTGTTAVTTTNSFFRINSVVTTAGNAVGTIYVKDAGGVTYAQINIGNGKTNMSIFTVPAGYTYYLYQIDAWSSTSVTSGVYATFRALLTNSSGVNNVVLTIPFLNAYNVTRPFPIPYSEKTDIQWQCKSSGSGLGIGTLVIGVLVQNDGQALASAI
jgi:hypothetical protein